MSRREWIVAFIAWTLINSAVNIAINIAIRHHFEQAALSRNSEGGEL